MKEIVAGNDDREKEQDDQEVAEKKKESSLEAKTEQDERKVLDTDVEKDGNDENQAEDDETEEYVIDAIIDHKINQSRWHRYVKYGENLCQVR